MRPPNTPFVKIGYVLTSLLLMMTLFSYGQAENLADTASNALIIPYDQDFATFKRLRDTLLDLSEKARDRSDLFGSKRSDDNTLLRPDKRNQILSIWYPIIDNYMALDALSEKYAGFYRLKPKSDRQRAFHLARSLFLTQYRIALDVITVMEQNPVVDTILNEAYPPMGLPSGSYAHFKYRYLNVIKAGRYAALEAVSKAYKPPHDAQLVQWAREDSRIIREAGKGPGPLMTFKNGISIIKQLGHTAWFPVQKGVAQWMGHTKVHRPHQYLIQPEQIKALSDRLEPGDIFLERRDWYLTNVGIPGFWTHAALYIGTADQRNALSDHPEVKAWLMRQGAKHLDELIKRRHPEAWEAMQIPCEDGRMPQVIEAISPGVTFTSLNHSASCDSLAVLRPQLSMSDRAAAVVRAMRYHGRPYDYAFDFGSDQSLVCTELIVKSYLPGVSKNGLQLPIERVMGRMLTPANAFARQFDRTFATPHQQLDLVLFLDGNEKEKIAAESDVASFRRSWKRPKWHILVEYAKINKKTQKKD